MHIWGISALIAKSQLEFADAVGSFWVSLSKLSSAERWIPSG